jgi:hypothetical protein
MTVKANSADDFDVLYITRLVTLAEAILIVWLGAFLPQAPYRKLREVWPKKLAIFNKLCPWDVSEFMYTGASSHNPLEFDVVAPANAIPHDGVVLIPTSDIQHDVD